jgi:hypothetical protein
MLWSRLVIPESTCCQPTSVQSPIESSFCSSAYRDLTSGIASFSSFPGWHQAAITHSGPGAQFLSSSGSCPVTHSVARTSVGNELTSQDTLKNIFHKVTQPKTMVQITRPAPKEPDTPRDPHTNQERRRLAFQIWMPAPREFGRLVSFDQV